MPGSIKRDSQTLQVTSQIYNAVVAVVVNNINMLPDLFRQGKG